MHDVRTRLMLSSGLLLFAAALATGGLTGCSTAGYYGQAMAGHWKIMRAREPVQAYIEDSSIDEKTRSALIRAQSAREFASRVLKLPANDSYSSFVDIERDAVTWNVVATQPFSVEPERWCFPVAGCLSYRGYFHQEDAQKYAQKLREQGLDVVVTEADAYSSLGWFDDPLLSTMIRRPEPLLAGVIFHELAHQQLYVKDDSSFNESFANFVERQGIQDWLVAQNKRELQQRYDRYLQRRIEFLTMLRDLRAELHSLYSSGSTESKMRVAKQSVFADFRQRYREQKLLWNGYSGYDAWFDKPLNNARVSSVSTYNRWVGAFATLFAESGDDYARFYHRSAEIAALPRADRTRLLEAAN